jgi:hypothetical protein
MHTEEYTNGRHPHNYTVIQLKPKTGIENLSSLHK